MKYFGGCDVGSTYTKAVILDETGKMVADTTIRSKINSEQSAIAAMDEVLAKVGLKSSKELEYLIGTGYGRNKVPFADENISEISCHAMGVHVTDPSVKAIIDIGGQDVKGISIDTDGTVKLLSAPFSLSPRSSPWWAKARRRMRSPPASRWRLRSAASSWRRRPAPPTASR